MFTSQTNWLPVVERLTESNARLTVSVADLTHELEILRRKNEELADHIKKMNEVPTQFASGPLWMSEEEEDLHDAYARGDIDKQGLAERLFELGLNPEITNA